MAVRKRIPTHRQKQKKQPPAVEAGSGQPTDSGRPSIRIRMYRVGFGDCFLITLAGTHHILVDCGVHAKGNINLNGENLIDLAFQNIQQESGQKLAIVIATHAHQDHVSGYGRFADKFKEFEIGEVWMPWTEDESNSTATKWRQKKQALVALLQAHFAAAPDPAAAAVVANAQSNAKAMSALHRGFGKAKVRYLKAGDELDAPAGLHGFSAKILGPPQDQAFLSKMNPPKSDEYLRMAATAGKRQFIRPFLHWELSKADLATGWPQLDEKLTEMIEEQRALSARAVAFSLDKVLNNTSIVALFSWAGKSMLFPGDAQYGDWLSWYKNSGAELLSNVCFYKVAHHCSHNATPKGALEEMPQGKFAAMASTQNEPWKSIPRLPLVDALDRQTNHAFVRSDSLQVNVKGVPNGPPLPANLPAGFDKGQVSKGEYWVDYNIA